MKTLIVNGSPRPNGDTAALLKALKEELQGEVVELSAFRSNISPCIDCRKCSNTGKCIIHDDMDIIYGDDFDNVVLAAPIYYSTLPGQVLSLMSRFQNQRAFGRTLPKEDLRLKPKRGALILSGGEKHNEQGAIRSSSIFFRMVGAEQSWREHIVMSLDTDKIPACEDEAALAATRDLAAWLEGER